MDNVFLEASIELTPPDSQATLDRMNKSAFFLVAVSCLALTSCQTAPAGDASAMPKNPVPEVEQSPIEADRLSSLESRVGTLESKMQSAEPTLEKVEVIESHFRALSVDLARIEETYKTRQPAIVTPEPTPKPVAVKPQPEKKLVKKADVKQPEKKPEAIAKKVASTPEGAAVTSVRIGEQKGEITRIVLDTSKAADLHYDLDNGEHILVIDLAGNEWQATKDMTLKNSPMVKSFTGTSDENGAHLVLQLKQSARVAATARLNPSGSYGHRVYLDLVPSK